MKKRLGLLLVTLLVSLVMIFAACTPLPDFVVTFDSNGGSAVESVEVEYDGLLEKPQDPTKQGYTFDGWYLGEAEFDFETQIRENITLVAKWSANTDTAYVVKHLQENVENSDYTEVEADREQKYGTTATLTEAVAKEYEGFTAQAINQKEIAADGSTVVEIYYARNSYEITFLADDGQTVLKKEAVKFGATPVAPTAPAKEGDAQYTYTFAGWDKELAPVTGEATYVATYSSQVKTYTIVFVDEDETVLDILDLAYGETPAYTGEIPTKAGDAQYSYTFAGWNVELAPVTGEATYVATYSQSVNQYTVVFKDAEGNEISSQTLDYGSAIEVPNVSAYERSDKFMAWNSAIAESLTANVEYSIVYKPLTTAGAMWNFDDANIVSSDYKEDDGAAFYVKHHADLNGENGVVEVTSTYGDWVWEANFLQGGKAILSEIPAGSNALFIKMKAASDFDLTLYPAYKNAVHGDALVCYSYRVTTEWSTLVVTGEAFEHFVTFFGDYKNGLAMFLPNGATLYISEFYVGKLENNSITVQKGSEVSLPSVNYAKLCIDSMTSPDGSAIQVTDGKFIASQKGSYTLSYTAVDANGLLVVGNYIVNTYTALEDYGAIWNFSDPSIVANDYNANSGTSFYSEWLSSHDGEEGVLAVHNIHQAEWNWNVRMLNNYTDLIKTDADFAKITEADALFIRIKASVANVVTIYGADDIGASLICYEYNVPTEWTTLVITGENLEHFKTYQAHYRGAIRMPMKFAGTIYISEFYMGKLESDSITVDKGSEVEIPAIPYDLFRFDGITAPDGSSVELVDGKFVASQGGAYTLSYTAVDESGLLVVGSFVVEVLGTPVEMGAIWDFNDPNIVANDYNAESGASFYSEWLSSHDGEEGVLAVHNIYQAEWNWNVRMLNGYTDLIKTDAHFARITNANALFIRIKASVANVVTIYGTDDIGGSLICYEYNVPTEWTTLVITGENLEHFKTYQAHYRGGIRMPMKFAGTIYISEFYMANINVLAPTNEVVSTGEVAISDNSLALGCKNVKYSVAKADGTPVTVTDGKFVAEEGVYVVSYTGVYNNLGLSGSYSILAVSANNGDWNPALTDWGKQGDAAYDNISVIPGIGYRVECSNSACHTRMPSLKEYMQANGLTTVTIKIYCVTDVALGSTLHGHTNTINYSAGQVVVFENVNLFEADYYIQSIWNTMTYYVVIDLGLTA